MFEAIKNRETKKLEELLKNNPQLVDDSVFSKSKVFPVEVAVKFQNLEALKLLVEKGATLNNKNIDSAALRSANKSILDYLLASEENIFDHTLTKLHIQAGLKIEDEEAFKKLISESDINAKYKNVLAPFIIALINNNMVAVTCIYENDRTDKIAIVNEVKALKYKDDNTVFHELAREGRTEACRFVLDKNMLSVDVENKNKKIPLEFALSNHHMDTAKCIYEKDKKANTAWIKKYPQKNDGKTLLCKFVEEDNTEACQFLLDNHISDVIIESRESLKVFFAVKSLEMLKLLFSYGFVTHSPAILQCSRLNKDLISFAVNCQNKSIELINLCEQRKWTEINTLMNDPDANYFINSGTQTDQGKTYSLLDTLIIKACYLNKNSETLNRYQEILKTAKKIMPEGVYEIYRARALNYCRLKERSDIAHIFDCTSTQEVSQESMNIDTPSNSSSLKRKEPPSSDDNENPKRQKLDKVDIGASAQFGQTIFSSSSQLPNTSVNTANLPPNSQQLSTTMQTFIPK